MNITIHVIIHSSNRIMVDIIVFSIFNSFIYLIYYKKKVLKERILIEGGEYNKTLYLN